MFQSGPSCPVCPGAGSFCWPIWEIDGSMIASLKDSDELQLSTYCDGELAPVPRAEFERRLANDPSLQAQYARLLSLRQAVRSVPQLEMPAGLQERIQKRLDAEFPSNVTILRRRNWSFQALAAAAVFGAVLSSSMMDRSNASGQREYVTNAGGRGSYPEFAGAPTFRYRIVRPPYSQALVHGPGYQNHPRCPTSLGKALRCWAAGWMSSAMIRLPRSSTSMPRIPSA